ncbi:MAG: hypothetical protein KDB27_11605 [Planctomycetales bacterium]|nr:hypothetical protein [Planctomycetales bacterium]
MAMARMAFWLSALLVSTAHATTWTESFHDDACLNDVFFVDETTGWCVGDFGTIIHTRDAGNTWETQESHVGCSLKSVHFVNQKSGWAVGGQIIPYTGRSASVLLKTENGGETWERIDTDLIPWLLQIRFFDAQNGIACGHSSSIYPSGIATTQDGGRTWTGLRGRSAFACMQLAVDSTLVGFGVTQENALLSLASSGAKPAINHSQPDRDSFSVPFAPTTVSLVGEDTVIAAGRRGRLRITRDQGRTWNSVSHSAGPIEFSSISTVGQNAWTCGTPGNSILHTPDGGRTWHAIATGNTLPLKAIHFLNEHNGWAVGELGTMLRTIDGGRSWQLQRSLLGSKAPRQAAFVVVTNDASSLPWEQLAEHTVIDGFRTVVVDFDEQSTPPETDWQNADAAKAIGISSYVTLRENDVRELANLVRIWRPGALLVHNTNQSTSLYSQVASAVDAAKQRDIRLNLRGHDIERIAEFHSTDDNPVPTDQVSISLSATTHELASQARARFRDRHFPPPNAMRLYLATNAGPQLVPKTRNLVSAAAQTRGQAARRLEDKINPSFGRDQNSVIQRRNIRAIALRRENSERPNSLNASQLLHQLPEAERADLLFELASDAERHGEYDSAVAMLQTLLGATPNHETADAAAQMLLILTASAEVELARAKKNLNIATTVTADAEVPLSEELDPATPMQETRQASFAVKNVHDEPTPQDRLAELQKIQKHRPSLYYSPTMRFPVAAFQRRSKFGEEAVRFYQSQLRGVNDFAWRSVASSELGLHDGKSPILKSQIHAAPTDTSPLLDGILDEPMWSNAKPIEIENTNGETQTSVRISFDREFLYVAVEAFFDPSSGIPKPAEQRQRDVDMANKDHVCLRFDCDRDYATYWTFAVDCQGNAREELNGNVAWDPVWYFANAQGDDRWTIEAAIHLNELTLHSPLEDVAWAIEVSRNASNGDVAHWPASKTSDVLPQDFGLLRFSMQ